jgi:hypothetical protein
MFFELHDRVLVFKETFRKEGGYFPASFYKNINYESPEKYTFLSEKFKIKICPNAAALGTQRDSW